jgi:hypothetical protein
MAVSASIQKRTLGGAKRFDPDIEALVGGTVMSL